MRLYCEEQEDGEERPDLDFGLTVGSLLGGQASGKERGFPPGDGDSVNKRRTGSGLHA
jgi:hypothetical protein